MAVTWPCTAMYPDLSGYMVRGFLGLPAHISGVARLVKTGPSMHLKIKAYIKYGDCLGNSIRSEALEYEQIFFFEQGYLTYYLTYRGKILCAFFRF